MEPGPESCRSTKDFKSGESWRVSHLLTKGPPPCHFCPLRALRFNEEELAQLPPQPSPPPPTTTQQPEALVCLYLGRRWPPGLCSLPGSWSCLFSCSLFASDADGSHTSRGTQQRVCPGVDRNSACLPLLGPWPHFLPFILTVGTSLPPHPLSTGCLIPSHLGRALRSERPKLVPVLTV